MAFIQSSMTVSHDLSFNRAKARFVNRAGLEESFCILPNVRAVSGSTYKQYLRFGIEFFGGLVITCSKGSEKEVSRWIGKAGL